MNKAMLEKWILPYLTIGERGFQTTVPSIEIVECIFHRLKTGRTPVRCQWRKLSTKQFFSGKALHWNSVFYYYKWSRADCWKKIWVNLLNQNLKHLDLSSVEFDGSHTLAKNGGDAVGCQGRKAFITTNALFVSDDQGVMLAMSTPQVGQHYDLFAIQTLLNKISELLKEAGINLNGLFLNADPGFDSAEFVAACAKEEIVTNIKANPRNSSH